MPLFARTVRAPKAGSPSRSRWVTLIFLALLQFLIAVDVTVVNIALPAIRSDFDVDTRQLTWVVTGYTVVGGGLLMVGGRIADLFGRRRTLLLGALLFGLASLAAGLAPSLELLILARFAQGAGEALALPAAMSLLALLFPETVSRSKALSVWATVASSGLVLGFLLSGVITEFFHWRWIFLINIPVIALVLGAILLLVERDTVTERAALDLPGTLLITAAPLLLIFGVIELGEGEPRLPLAIGALVAAVLCALAFVAVERRASRPLVPLSFFANRVRMVANGATILLSAGLSTSFFLLTIHLQETRGLSPIAAGVTFLPLAISLILISTVVPRIIERAGLTRTAVIGMTVAALGIACFALLPEDGSLLTGIVPGMVLLACGMGIGLVALQNAALHGVTEADAGMASGVQRCADQLGGAGGIALYIGIGFSPHLGDSIDPYTVAYGLAAAGLVAAIIAVPAMSADRTAAEAPGRRQD